MAKPVLIVGAGPVGLTAAAALTHHGVPCRIIDKAPAPSDKSKALAVWSRTLELLDGLGLAETFVRSGLKLSGGSTYAGSERLIHLELTSGESPYGFPVMIPQYQTERLLAEHLAAKGVTVERQAELLSFAEGTDSVACRLRLRDGSEEEFDAAWLVGCDGAHSTVRHVLGLMFDGFSEPSEWTLADAHVRGPIAPDEVSVFWHEAGTLLFIPIETGRYRVMFDSREVAGTAPRQAPTLPEVQTEVDRRGPGGLTVSDPFWLTTFRINERKVSDYRSGRAFLAGDAAHVHSPAGGQGMNTGMQDAFNLAWKLALVQSGRAEAEPLLQSYSAERSVVGDQVLKNAGRATAVATLRRPGARWLRDHLAPILGSFQFVRDSIRDDWLELSINYRHSPLSAERWPWLTGGLAAGDRMCDAPLTSASGDGPTTLFALMRGETRHTLLLLPGADGGSVPGLLVATDGVAKAFPDVLNPLLILDADAAPPDPSGIPAWLDAEGRLRGRLQPNAPAFVLVRPDGYIGYRCQPADKERLMDYLGGYLVRKG
jgi:2-polyprenyl-6-methoxyphenol hydroxylase-like FAD-dependent oxidoreductase